MSERIDSILNSIVAGDGVDEKLDLMSFRDLCHQLRGAVQVGEPGWVLVFLGTTVIAQLRGARDVTVAVSDGPNRQFKLSDFAFLDTTNCDITGAIDGQYRFSQFVADIVRPFGIFVVVGVFMDTAAVFGAYASTSGLAKLCELLVSSLSIFISIFVFFALTLDPAKDFVYLSGGTFDRLSHSDRYIATIAVSALIVALFGASIASGARPPLSIALRSTVVGLAACALTLAALSFYLVLTYHFSRRHEMLESSMVRAFLASVQRQRASTTKPERR